MRAIVAAALALGLGLAIVTVAWAAPSLSIDSGPSGPTNDATPSFTFTVDADATVACSVDQGVEAYGPCTSATSHSAAPLADGEYTFRVRATDAGDEQTVEERGFSVDTVAPAVGGISGPSGPTNDPTPSFGFTAEVGATVACSVDEGTPDYGSCSTAATHTAGALADGSYVFHVRATDAAGNQAEASQAFSVDATPPSLSIGTGPVGPTNDSMPSFGFTAEAGATVECSIDQAAPPYGPCTGPATHDVGTALPEGTHVFRVRATDGAGNDAIVSRTFTVDTTPPSLSIDSGPPGPTNDKTPTFGFTAGPGATVECSVDHGTAAYGSCSSATSHTAAALADGSYVFHVRATDAAGNQAEASRPFSVDTAAPAVGGISGPSGPTNDPTPSFGFTAEAGATVACSIDHGTPVYGSCSSATSHTAAALADGSYVFHVRATDAAGNQGFASQAFAVDSAAPSLSIDSGPSGPTSDTAPSFGFTAEAGATVACSIDQGSPAYGPCTSPATHVVGTALPEGTHVFRVRAIDGGGNDAIQSRTFTVDTTPPSLSIGFGPSGTTNDSTPLFGFSAEAGATVECSIDQGAPAYGPCASASTHAAVAPLADGAYVLRVRATDGAGNQTIVTRAFTVDTVPQGPGPGGPAPDPTPPVDPPVTPTPSEQRLMSPFPLVRIAGTLTPTGARINRLTVRAPRGATVRVTITPACSTKGRSSRRCRVLHAAGTVGGSALIGFRGLRRTYRSGTVIVVRVWSADRIGKYTRFTIRRGKAPRRVDQCLVPEATRGSRCPSA